MKKWNVLLREILFFCVGFLPFIILASYYSSEPQKPFEFIIFILFFFYAIYLICRVIQGIIRVFNWLGNKDGSDKVKKLIKSVWHWINTTHIQDANVGQQFLFAALLILFASLVCSITVSHVKIIPKHQIRD